jgi:hypothetical protein
LVLKTGDRVSRSEEVAIRLVSQHTDVPVPEIYASNYVPNEGRIALSYVPGTTLDKVWDPLDDQTKERLCHELWDMVAELRQIPKPTELQSLFLCRADGTHSPDPLVCDQTGHPPLMDDNAVRARIYQRYYNNWGRKYEHTLLDMLPRSNLSVFAHGDLSPRNVMFDPDSKTIAAIIDWEMAGWFPDYWEWVSIMRPSRDHDFQEWMGRTKPEEWDISGITKARGLLLLPI